VVVRTKDEIVLARVEARRLQRANPSLFGELPVRVSELATALGVKIEKRATLKQRAQLEVFGGPTANDSTIVLERNLDPNAVRFALAHEIGHVVLLKNHPQKAQQWDVPAREEFANAFAAELLTPSQLRGQLTASFRDLSDPIAFLRLASRLGLSPAALFAIAGRESGWVRGINRIWLRVKYANNAFTGSEPKLRIITAIYDRTRFFIPTNQSLTRFTGDEKWLVSSPYGSVVRYTGAVSLSLKRTQECEPKFLRRKVPADLSAVRLRPSARDPGAYLVILAQLNSPSADQEM